MHDLLTTQELQAILQVDRTTIYRMAESGKLPAIKVGNQWRFPRDQVEGWLYGQGSGAVQAASVTPGMGANSSILFPLECVQLIQDGFADALGVMMLVTDLEGEMITHPSNPCGLYTATEHSPVAQRRCAQLWSNLAKEPALAPRFAISHLGLLCARGLIRVGSEIMAMLVVGGIAPAPWPPSELEMQRIAKELDLAVEVIHDHVNEVHRLEAQQQARVLPFVQRIADILAHIASERYELTSRLQRIAEITRL